MWACVAFHYYNEYTDNTVNDIKTDAAVLEAGAGPGYSRLLFFIILQNF